MPDQGTKHCVTRATVGVEPFDTGYGGGFQVQVDSPDAMACKLVEDGGEFRRHVPATAVRPRRLAFVDGTMRVEARLTRTDVQGTVTGLAGSWGAGAVLADGARLLRFDRITIGRAAIFSAGQRVELPPQPGGWSWEADSTLPAPSRTPAASACGDACATPRPALPKGWRSRTGWR